MSVVIVVFRDPQGLALTLRSLRGLDERFEVVVVEGEESTTGIAGEVLKASDHAPATLLVNGRDNGPYDAMNRGILTSSGQWIWFVNAGDEVAGDLDVEVLTRELESNPSPWAVGPVRLMDEGTMTVNPTATPAQILAGSASQCHQGVFVSRRAIAALGGFDTRYAIAADYHMMCRLAMCTAPLVLTQDVAVFHRGGISSTRRRRLYAEFFLVRCSLRTQSVAWHVKDLARLVWRLRSSRV